MLNSLTEIWVWLDLFETKLGIIYHFKPNYFIVKLQIYKISVASDEENSAIENTNTFPLQRNTVEFQFSHSFYSILLDVV